MRLQFERKILASPIPGEEIIFDDFIAPYEAASGRKVGTDDLHYWQVMAHIRWSIIALQQAQRFLTGGESSLELALTGKIVAELEWEVLQPTDSLA